MFYSQFILAKKGPLGTIWIAAHLERKLRKNQVADTDIGVSVDSILFPDVPIALRLSSHLLLGVVRIYNRKVNYLFDDCSEALLKIKQAFRSTAVDLPPEESKAPYHSITLPETFDLDDFELPDSDIFQGNYVDHHISSREQITLQDNMEGVSYSTSKFGLDERFGDGDASGLDLDEELFLEKIVTAGGANESANPQASISSPKQVEHPEDRGADSETMVDGIDGDADVIDYAPGPSTPGLVEEPNLATVQEVSACDEHIESEYTMRESEKSSPHEDKQEVNWCFRDPTISDGRPQGSPDANEHLSEGLKTTESKHDGESFINDTSEDPLDLLGHVGGTAHTSELTGSMIKIPGGHCGQNLSNVAAGNSRANKIGSRTIPESSSVASPCQQVTEDHSMLGVDAPGSVENASNGQKSIPEASEIVSENQDGLLAENPKTESHNENAHSCVLDIDDRDKDMSGGTLFLRSCISIAEQTDGTESACNVSDNADLQSDDACLDTSEKQEITKEGEEYAINGESEQPLKENQEDKPELSEHYPAGSVDLNDLINNSKSPDKLVENSKNSEEAVLSAPEKLLSVPEGHVGLDKDMLDMVSPGEFEVLDEADAGSKTVAGKKRSFTESTLTEQSLNSAESSRQVRGKRTAESVPDDNDLLSSILVGRRSSVLKVKPTPPISEVTSVKRTRTSLRSGAPKRKVVMDDTMVLHGDTIRHQLMNTEDIRRVRKKAPCTRPEIRTIQMQHMEDEIFLESVLPGMSLKLASLHSQVYDLTQIRVCQDDVTKTSPEIVAEPKVPLQSETVVGMKFSPSVEHDVENDGVSDRPTITTQNGLGSDIEHWSAREEPTEAIDAFNEDRSEEPGHTNAEVNARQEPVKSDMGTVVPQQDLSQDAAELETSQMNDGPVNKAFIAGMESLDFIGHDINDTATAHMVQTVSLNEIDAYASAVSPSQKQDTSVLELDSVDMDYGPISFNDAQTIGRDELIRKDGDVTNELGTRDDNVAQDAEHGDLERSPQNEIYDATLEEELGEFSYSAKATVLEDGFLNNGQNPFDPDSYQPNLIDPEFSAFGMQDQDEFSHLATENDTDFLNVDDDDLNEMADDDVADAQEARFTENTGWSSRTRAVSKYLQTTFMKEAESGKKYLSMDNLLMGKSRKEASRMFFETLVLKTRDYIHVEQKNPFGDINIKPRTKLMKSEF